VDKRIDDPDGKNPLNYGGLVATEKVRALLA